MSSDYLDFTNELLANEKDLAEMQKLQDDFCAANHVYCVCVLKSNEQITSFSGSKLEEDFVVQNFSNIIRQQLMDSFLDDVSEDVVAVEGSEQYLLYRAVAIRNTSGKVVGAWLLMGVDAACIGDGVFIPGEVMRTTPVEFDKAVVLLASLTSMYYGQRQKTNRIQADLSKMVSQEKELEYRLQKTEILTEILKMMESDNSFSKIAEDVLGETGEYLGCSNCFLLQLNSDNKTVEMLAEWRATGADSLMQLFNNVDVSELPFMNGKPYTISSDSTLMDDFAAFFSRFDIRAGIFLPLTVSGKPGMYICVVSIAVSRKWSLEDIKFANDVKRILQTILVKRITKNSLASSYSALESILENTGCGVSVNDVYRHETLFVNETFKQMFTSDKDKQAIETIIYNKSADDVKISGYSSMETGKWYDLSFANITWVDGRDVKLSTFYDISDIKNYQRKIEKQASLDYLTGLYNRKKLEVDLEQEIKYVLSNDGKCAVLILDLDDFNNVNDALGHQNGNLLLKDIAAALRGISGLSEYCYRSGGDEFIILVNHENIDKLKTIVAKIQELFRTAWNVGSKEFYCTVSMGVAQVPQDGSDNSSIMRHADLALHEAKKEGKNRVATYNSDAENEATERLALEKYMRKAVSEGCKEFEVYYQPLINVGVTDAICCGAEALVRWNNPEMGLLTPDSFIPLAEYLGLIVPIGDYVMRQACEQVRYWNDYGHPEYKVNINLSVVQLLQNDIVEKVETVLKETGVEPHNITFEVTESLAINDLNRMNDILDRIRRLGCRVALDDFGTGFSSLNHIRSMPIDTIKIDRCFVKDIGKDDFSHAFVRTVSELADTLHMDVCVEGVEEANQQELISSMKGINLIQGYFYDKPLTAKEFRSKYL